MRDAQGARALVRTLDVAVSEVETMSFVGSGDSIARFVAAGFRAVKESGAEVGGNTEVVALGNMPLSSLLAPDEEQEYFWGLHNSLLRTVRLMLMGDHSLAAIWADGLKKQLKRVQDSCQRSHVSSYQDLHMFDWATDFDDPFGDVH